MSKIKVGELNEELHGLSAEKGLALIGSRFGRNARFSTSFGLEDQVITHLIASSAPGIEIFTLDTGRLFQETYDVFALTAQKYQLQIVTYFPDQLKTEDLLKRKGPNSFYESVVNRKECCFIRKVEPLSRALTGASVWITGLRSEQSANRSQVAEMEWDDQYQLLKYNPLISWSWDEVRSFADHNSIPVNSLHRKGFPSIGCAPCTRAILPGEDARAGRWWWENSNKECGLHEHKAAPVLKS
ncbi:phosphoadenosine phosphosulfate reductase [Cytophagales bacterium WSM2-2]|nr:phosphoadenosine phosphosulfate reductase [Cytophagales bacterium WSM2-2]